MRGAGAAPAAARCACRTAQPRWCSCWQAALLRARPPTLPATGRRYGGVTDAVLYDNQGMTHALAVGYGGMGVKLSLAQPLFVTDVPPEDPLLLEVYVNTSMWTDPQDFPCGESKWVAGRAALAAALLAGLGS